MENLIKNLRIIAITALCLFLLFKFFAANSNLENILGIVALSSFTALLIVFTSKLIRKYYLR